MRNLLISFCIMIIIGALVMAAPKDLLKAKQLEEQTKMLVQLREAEEVSAMLDSGVPQTTEQSGALPMTKEEEQFYGGTTNNELFKRLSAHAAGTTATEKTASGKTSGQTTAPKKKVIPEPRWLQNLRISVLTFRCNKCQDLIKTQPVITGFMTALLLMGGVLILLGSAKWAQRISSAQFWCCNIFLLLFSMTGLSIQLAVDVNIFTFAPKLMVGIPVIFLVLSAILIRWTDKSFLLWKKLGDALMIPSLCALVVFGWDLLPAIVKGA